MSFLPPSNLTPLAALPVLAFDLETTGLDVRSARIVQIGAVAMQGERILTAPRIEQWIDPGVEIPAASTAVHGIDHAQVLGAPRFRDMAAALRDDMSGRVLVGHHIAYDLAVMRHEAARAGIAWRDPPSLDLALLVGALDPGLADPTLEAIAARFSIPIHGRHSALGDAMAAAGIFAALIGALRSAGVQTLGEARALSQRRGDLLQRHAASGWHVEPGDALVAAPARGTRLDAFVFEYRVADVMNAPPVFIVPDATLLEAARRMTDLRIGALLVGTASAPPLGVLTERDVLRATASEAGGAGARPVASVMSSPVESVAPGELLYRALGRMDRLGVRHLCVADDSGRAIGMVSQRDLLRHRARSASALGDAIAVARGPGDLVAAYAHVPAVAAGLEAEGVGGVGVARVVSNELRALTARAAQLAAERLRETLGGAPAPWCFLVLGSGGRGESLLGADQDNALIHAGSDADDAWFAAFGEAVAECLREAGVPRCAGGVMAANAAWRGSVPAWQARIDAWLQRANRDDLLNVDIFFDLHPAAGEIGIARQLHHDAVVAAAHTPPFIALLAESITAMASPLGMFGRLRTEGGRIDLKRCGLLPLVGLARALALRVGSRATSTPERLHDATAAGRLSDSDADLLIEIQENLMTLILRQQLSDLEAGLQPSSRIEVRRLGRDATRVLKRQLSRLEEIVQALRGAVAG